VPLFELPFSRDVSLDRVKLRLMRMQLERCRRSGGFLCVSKEHRQSLMLKQQVRLPKAFPAAPQAGQPGYVELRIVLPCGAHIYIYIYVRFDKLT
jgi:hypothetical protein